MMDDEFAGFRQETEVQTYYAATTGGVGIPMEQDIAEDEEEIFRRMRLIEPTSKYRETSIGKSLAEALDDLRYRNKISIELYNKVLNEFDRTMVRSLQHKLAARVSFKAERLMSYKLIENIWVFKFKNVEFRENNCFANVPSLQVTAFEPMANLLQSMPGGRPGATEFEIRSATSSTRGRGSGRGRPRGRGRGRGRASNYY